MKRTSSYIVVGIDPGKENFAVVAITSSGNVVLARMVQNTIKSMAAKNAGQRTKFRAVMRRILAVFKPKMLISEEFVARGFGTQLTQLINLMLGSIMAVCDEIGCEEASCQASTWKNAYNKNLVLADAYAYGQARRVPPHIVDALCLAIFLLKGKTFVKVRKAYVNRTIRRAAVILPEAQRLKPKRIKKSATGTKLKSTAR